MNTTTRRLHALALLSIPFMVACTTAPEKTHIALLPSDTPVAEVTPISLPSATPAPVSTSTPQSTSTLDQTQAAIDSFSATAQAVVTAVSAQGVDPFSPDGAAAVNATLGALSLVQSPTPVPSKTPTPLPFPVLATSILDQSSHVIGTHYEFANPEDLRAVQQVYERYFDFISFRNGPPPQNLDTELGGYIQFADSLPSPQSCRAADVSGAISSLVGRGYYIRLTLANGIRWKDDAVHLFIGPSGIEAALDWSAKDVLVEQVDIQTEKTLKQDTVFMSGTAELVYAADSATWHLVDDANGFYCSTLNFFLR